jgi:dihydroorotate dehydrogenase
VLLNASGCLDALTAPDVARSLDAYVTKTVTPLPRGGNEPVRIAETDLGMLNSIGLANPGIDRFVDEYLPRLAELGVPLWVSVGGFSVDDYAQCVSRLDAQPEVSAIELNLSCPNVDAFEEPTAEIVEAARAETSKPLYAKLSPAVPDVAAVAVAARAAGADGLSLVNTIRGLALDERTLQPILARGVPHAHRGHGRSGDGTTRAGAAGGRCEPSRARHRALRRPRRGGEDPRRARPGNVATRFRLAWQRNGRGARRGHGRTGGRRGDASGVGVENTLQNLVFLVG